MSDIDHHVGISPLAQLKFGLVSSIVLDPMHLIYLGATRKLLFIWIKGKIPHRLPSRLVAELSTRNSDLAKYSPSEFVRKPRSFRYLDHFKSTEYRQFLLYTGPVILYGILPTEKFDHFILLHVACRILCTNNVPDEYLVLAQQLLVKFVEEGKKIYGKEFLVYNIHSLVHVVDDVRRYGALDSYSAWPFENRMQFFKKLLRGKQDPLAQVVRRILEMNVSGILHCAKTSTDNSDNFKVYMAKGDLRAVYKDHLVSSLHGDNCFLTIDGKIIKVRKILADRTSKVGLEKMCLEANVLQTSEFKQYPVCSSKLQVFSCSKDIVKLIKISFRELKQKFILLPFSETVDICFPLFQSIF
ncbi:unnamed protein product [Allacma fusca]|uniref:DUF4218 domain-containing protein n=1 Tax=Allacma fusca TaxID=39272 RepID=A0A8J2P626_9HEXA|nr:unnamed protein product [Allacma fusca]